MTKKTTAPIDPDSLHITDEEFVDAPRIASSKYDAIFAKLRPGQRLVCPPGVAARLAQTLRVWLQKRGHRPPLVKNRNLCQDGMGGVWWLGAKEQAAPLPTLEPIKPASSVPNAFESYKKRRAG